MEKEIADKWRRWLVDDVLEYLNITRDELLQRLNNKPLERNAIEWQSKTSINDFYRTNKTQFWDEVSFNLNPSYWEDHFQCAEVKDMRILDFGCGIGTSALYQAVHNYVVGYEINEMCLDFCKYRKAKFKYDNLIFTNIMPCISGFNLVMAIDVLEHLPNLHDTILQWGQEAFPQTVIYHADVFENHPEHHPMHYDYSKEIDAWFKEAGFERAGVRVAIKR
jgi:2-polyprenyl-3-methyl-5-hydroxy-6-metoxy-1,4-benzoquinol methylase